MCSSRPLTSGQFNPDYSVPIVFCFCNDTFTQVQSGPVLSDFDFNNGVESVGLLFPQYSCFNKSIRTSTSPQNMNIFAACGATSFEHRPQQVQQMLLVAPATLQVRLRRRGKEMSFCHARLSPHISCQPLCSSPSPSPIWSPTHIRAAYTRAEGWWHTPAAAHVSDAVWQWETRAPCRWGGARSQSREPACCTEPSRVSVPDRVEGEKWKLHAPAGSYLHTTEMWLNNLGSCLGEKHKLVHGSV